MSSKRVWRHECTDGDEATVELLADEGVLMLSHAAAGLPVRDGPGFAAAIMEACGWQIDECSHKERDRQVSSSWRDYPDRRSYHVERRSDLRTSRQIPSNDFRELGEATKAAESASEEGFDD